MVSSTALMASAGGLAGGLGWMGALGVASWKRTGSVRRGHFPEGRFPDQPAVVRTSWLTFLPASTGGALVAAAGGSVAGDLANGRAPPQGVLALGVIGIAVAVAGIATRVIELEIDEEALVVRYRLRTDFVARWDRVSALSPPRLFLGGWSVKVRPAGPDGPNAVRVLMPSDLWGHEWILEAVAERSGLTYHRGRWVRERNHATRAT